MAERVTADQVSTVVEAAGGVVWRVPAGVGPTEIALVHRPRYDDWSLPKGKLDPGEHKLDAAVREVFEETAIHGVPQARLPSIRYLTGEPGVEKVVHFWSMRADSWTEREPDHEIEAVGWVPAKDAANTLSYAHDRGVVKAFLDLPKVTAVVALVRHAKAGKKKDWDGDDVDRPLEKSGVEDAETLCRLLAYFRPVTVVSAEPVRCAQTVAPLGLPSSTDPVFNEEAPPGPAADALRRIAGRAEVSVVCSQGGLIPPLMVELTKRTNLRFDTPKGAGWVLSFAGDRLVKYEFLEP